jgi:hypothetical protein
MSSKQKKENNKPKNNDTEQLHKTTIYFVKNGFLKPDYVKFGCCITSDFDQVFENFKQYYGEKVEINYSTIDLSIDEAKKKLDSAINPNDDESLMMPVKRPQSVGEFIITSVSKSKKILKKPVKEKSYKNKKDTKKNSKKTTTVESQKDDSDNSDDDDENEDFSNDENSGKNKKTHVSKKSSDDDSQGENNNSDSGSDSDKKDESESEPEKNTKRKAKKGAK